MGYLPKKSGYFLDKSICLMPIVFLFLNLNWIYSQDTLRTSIPQGKWVRDRGPYDPRPYDNIPFQGMLFNQKYFDFKNNLWINQGFTYGGYVSANFQWGSQGGEPHGISETLILADWQLVQTEKSDGRIVFGLAHDRTFGYPTTREFADSQGLVETPNDLDTHPELTFTTLGLLLWSQDWNVAPDRGFGLRVGQIYVPSYFGAAKYLDDDRRYFMARPLSAAGGAQWVGYNDIGLGTILGAWKRPFYLTLGVIDGNANRKYPDFSSLGNWEMLYIGEMGLEWDPGGAKEATLRFTASHLDLDSNGGSGESLMISGDIQLSSSFALAGRWSKSFRRLTADYQELFSLGTLWTNPFSRGQDLMGFGLFSGKPSKNDLGWESGFEIFYKLQLTNAIGLMPDLQFWFRDDKRNENVESWVWGIRSEIEF